MFKSLSKVPRDAYDAVLDLAGLLAVAGLIALPLYHFGALPGEVPLHFGMDGSPDGYGSKAEVLVFTGISVVVVLGMLLAAPYAAHFNYPMKVKEENAAAVHQLGARMMRVLGITLGLLMLWISYQSIQTALGNRQGLDMLVTVLLLAALGVEMVLFILLMGKANKGNPS